MKKLALVTFALALCVTSASAQNITNPTPPSSVNGAYNATPPTCVDGSGCWVQMDANGNLKVNVAAGGASGGTASSFGAAFPGSGTAAGMAQGGNMVPFNGLAGNLLVNCAVGCAGGTFNNNADGVATSATNGQAAAWLYGFNGTTYDRIRADTTNGLWVNVKASALPSGAATQVTLASILTALGSPFQAGGSIPLPALASTSTKQSDGSQKSQVVDGSGNVIGATSNALDVNIKSGSSGLPSGAATAANQAATQAPVAPATATATKSDLVGCQATSAAINPTTGQQAAVDCDLNNNLLVSSGGAPNFSTSQVSVATSDTATVAARALRRSVTITNITGTQQVFCSGTTATTGNGQLIPATVGASFTVSTTAAIRCIAVTSAQTVSVAETF